MPYFVLRRGNSRMQSILTAGFAINFVFISLCIIYGGNARSWAQSLFFRSSCPALKELNRLTYLMGKSSTKLCRNTSANRMYSDGSQLCHLPKALDRELLKVVRQGSELIRLHGIHQDHTEMFVFTESDLESETIRLWHTWEPELVAWTLRFAQKLEDVTFLDIGSSIGVYSFQAAKLGLPVVALDANIRRLLRLHLTLSAESLDAALVWNFIAEDDDVRHLNFSAACVGFKASAALPMMVPVKPLKSEAVTDLIRTKDVVLKIDIDGAEIDFLFLSGKLFSDFNVPLVQIEWNPKLIPTGQSQAIIDFFTERGYHGLKVPGFQALNVTNSENYGFIDIIWIRKDYSHIADTVHL